MDKKTLNQYRALQKEVPMLQKEIEKLYKKLEEVPVVAGKVTKSSDDFPYIEEHISVEMSEPKQATEIRKRIKLKELRLDKAERDKTEIEEFVAGIEDSIERQVFELMYLNGNKRTTQTKVGEFVGYSQGRISQIIKRILKD